MDSVPALRLATITRLYEADDELSTTDVAVSGSYPTTTTRRTLEDLTALALVERRSNGKGKADTWRLTDEAREQFDAVRQPFPKSREADNGTVPEKSDGTYQDGSATSLHHPHRIDDDFSGTPSENGQPQYRRAFSRLGRPFFERRRHDAGRRGTASPRERHVMLSDTLICAIAGAVERQGGEMDDVDDLIATWERLSADPRGPFARLHYDAAHPTCSCADGGVPGDGRCARCNGQRLGS
jgi:hypothetical protein